MFDFLTAGGDLVIYAGYAMIGLAVFIVAHMLLKEEESRAAAENLADQKDRKATNTLVKWTRPFFSQYVVPVIRGKKGLDKMRHKYRRKLITAGLKEELTPDEFIGFKVVLIVVFPVVGGLLKALDLIDISVLTILGSGVAGFFYPDLWASGLIQIRQRQVRKSLPFIVDLLALSTEAGLDFMGAMGKVVEKSNPSPLVDEFEQVLKEIKVGSNRAQALEEMANRLDMREVSSFVAILISAEKMGASIGKVLRQQSETIRTERFLLAEKAGAAAAQKLMLPIVLIILPAVLLMVAGPFVLSFFGGTG